MSAPLPPQSSGMKRPMSPSSPMRRTVSVGKRASRSMASAMGRTSFSAKSRATFWMARCSSVSSRFMVVRLFLQELLELLLEGSGDLEEVPPDARIRDLEDGRLRILVDGADHLGGPHPGQMLDGARDPESEVQLRRDRPAGDRKSGVQGK